MNIVVNFNGLYKRTQMQNMYVVPDGDYFITIIWLGFVTWMAKDKSFTGTEESIEDMVSNGEVENDGNSLGTSSTAGSKSSRLLHSNQGRIKTSVRYARFEKDDSKLVQLTSSYDGGIASAKPRWWTFITCVTSWQNLPLRLRWL